MQTGAVVVAAGLSSRMGAFKPVLPLAGSSVIRTAISTLRAAGVSTIVVVTGHMAEPLTKHLADLEVVCIHNEDYARTDMFCSACMGLRHIQDVVDRTFFLPADVPLFSRQTLTVMLKHMDCTRCDIVVPVHNGIHGHPLLIRCGAISALLSYRGPKGLKGAVGAYGGAKEAIDLPDLGTTLDADEPEDYGLLRQYAENAALNEKRDRREG